MSDAIGSNWVDTTIGEQVTLQRGVDITRPQQRPGLVPVVSSGGIASYHDTPFSQGPGVVLGRKGRVGTVFYIDGPYWPHDTTLWVKDFKGNDPRFVYYFFLWQAEALSSLDVGTSNPTLNRNHVHPMPVRWPRTTEQQIKISDFLGSLDDQIELNQRICTALQGIAQAIFRSWFVDFDPVRAKVRANAEGSDPELAAIAAISGKNQGDLQSLSCETFDSLQELAAPFPNELETSGRSEIPQGWDWKVLDDLLSSALGGDWGIDTQAAENPEPALCIRGADIPALQQGGLGKMPLRFLRSDSLTKRQLRAGDIVIEVSGGSPTQCTGRAVLITRQLIDRAPLPIVCSNFCRFVRPQAAPESVYLLLRYLYDAGELEPFETGTTGIKNFAYTHFAANFPVAWPPSALLDKFQEAVSPLFSRIGSAAAECETLIAIRDALLPRLLSGELTLPTAGDTT